MIIIFFIQKLNSSFQYTDKKKEELKEGDFVKVLWSNKTYPALVRLIEKI